MDYFRIIGDVHGHISEGQACTLPRNKGKYYLDLIKDCEYSLQLGDMGFDYSPLMGLDFGRHCFIGGNHDNYDVTEDIPNYVKDFGKLNMGGIEVFYCRGAFSIDKEDRLRIKHKCWWAEEELTYAEGLRALASYERAKPKIMVTHDCPIQIARLIGNPQVLRNYGFNPTTFNTSTQQLLQAMFEIHQPDLWVFGHFHQNWQEEVNGTKFICVDELNYITLNERGELQ